MIYKSHGWEYDLDQDARTARIIKGRIGRHKRLRLPEKIRVESITYKIDSVEYGAFDNSQSLRHLVIPDSYNYIDEDTFRFFSNLRSVYIGKGVENLNSWHFTACPKLAFLVIDKGNPFMKVEKNLILSGNGKKVLRTLKDAVRYTIPDGVESISDIAFWSNNKLKSISFPNSLRIIGDDEFCNCEALEEMSFPEGLEEIGCQCFHECTNLLRVELPSTIKRIGAEAICGCEKLRTLVIKTPYVFRCKGFEYRPSIPENCTIYVSESLVKLYREDDFWKTFRLIQPIIDLVCT